MLNLKREEIDNIILVGGSTRIPAVRKLASELFEKTPLIRIDPKRVVAIGAADYRACLFTRSAKTELL